MMQEDNDANYNNLLEEFKINSQLDISEHKKVLDNIKNYADNEAVEILNFFVTKEINPSSLLYIIKLIGKYRDKSSASNLIDLLLLKDLSGNENSPYQKNDYLKVRCMVATVLGNIKNTDAVTPIMYVMNSKDENYKLRLACAEALGRIGDRFAVAPLMEIANDDNEKSLYVRESAAKALGMLGDMRAINTLVKIIEGKKGFLDKFTFLKERAVESIAKIGFSDRRTLKALQNALNDESAQVRLNAIEALMNYEHEESTTLIEIMIYDKNEDVGIGAIDALYNLNGDDYIKNLLSKEDLPIWCRDEINEILADEEEA